MRNERCAIWSTARLRVLGAQSGTRERTNKSGTRTGNERASRYTRTCEASRQEARDRGTSIPGALAFVNCAHEVSILRDPRRLDSLSLNRATAESLFEETSSRLRVYPRKHVNLQLERILVPAWRHAGAGRLRRNFTVELMKEAIRMGN